MAYLYVPGHQTVYFILAFAKNVQSNLSAEQKRLVRALAEDIVKEPWPRKHARSHRS